VRVDAAGVVDERAGDSGFSSNPRDMVVPHPQLESEEDLRVVLRKFDGIPSSVIQVAVIGSVVAGVLDRVSSCSLDTIDIQSHWDSDDEGMGPQS
jgi:hypothetical protein